MTNQGVGLFEKGTKNESPLQGIDHHISFLGMHLSVHTTQYFKNHSKESVEMVYKFHYEHTPHRLVVTLTDPETGRVDVLVGKMMKKEVAIEEYDDNLAEGNRAVMMERDVEDSSRYILSLGNTKGKMEIKIETTSVQQSTLETDDYFDEGDVEYLYSIPAMFPTSNGESNLMKVSLSLENIEQKNVVRVSSPSHPGIITKEKEKEKVMWRTKTQVSVTRDFDLSVKVRGIPLSSFVVSPVDYKNYKYAGVFSLLPSFPVVEDENVINEITIIVDCSGSMSGERIRCAREALKMFIHSLDVDRNIHYNFYRFGSSFRILFDEPVKLEEGINFDVTLYYIENLRSDLGGTDMYSPLQHYFSKIISSEDEHEEEEEEKPIIQTKRQLFLFTDGEDSHSNEIIGLLKKKKDQVRCFSFGIGKGVNKSFLCSCADVTNGTSAYIQDMKTEMNSIVMRQLSNSFRESIEDISISFTMNDDKQIVSTDDPSETNNRVTKIPFAYNGTSQHNFYFMETLPEDISISYTFQKNEFSDEKVSVKIYTDGEEGRYVGVMVAQDLFQKRQSMMSKEEQTDLGLTFHIPTSHTCYFLRQVVNTEEEEEGEKETFRSQMNVIEVQPPITTTKSSGEGLGGWDDTNDSFTPTATSNQFSNMMRGDDTSYFEEDFTSEPIKQTFAKPVSKQQQDAFKEFTYSRSDTSTTKPSPPVSQPKTQRSPSPPSPPPVSQPNVPRSSSSSFSVPKSRRSGPADDFMDLKVVGRGSFGRVIKVLERDSGDIFCMKMLKKDMMKPAEPFLKAKNLMMNINHPFINKLVKTFQSGNKVHLVYEFLSGGELFFHLKNETHFSVDKARFYIAEIALALGAFHEKNAIYTDLKPENCVLDGDGHVVVTAITQMGGSDVKTFCGTPEYLAPEILKGTGHDKSVDWWSLGVMLYEMLTGLPPFYSENVNENYKLILEAPLRFDPKLKIDAASQSLIKGLLERDPKKRLGSGVTDVEEIKAHPFFKTIDWDLLYQRKILPPLVGKYRYSYRSHKYSAPVNYYVCESEAIKKKLEGGGSRSRRFHVEGVLEVKGLKDAASETNWRNLLLLCDMRGIWGLTKRCCGLIGIEEEAIKERYIKKVLLDDGNLQNINIWVTAVVMAVFQTFYKKNRTEWRMVFNKARRSVLKGMRKCGDIKEIDIFEEAQMFVNELIE